jgi:hypothetical protein
MLSAKQVICKALDGHVVEAQQGVEVYAVGLPETAAAAAAAAAIQGQHRTLKSRHSREN